MSTLINEDPLTTFLDALGGNRPNTQEHAAGHVAHIEERYRRLSPKDQETARKKMGPVLRAIILGEVNLVHVGNEAAWHATHSQPPIVLPTQIIP